MRSFLIFVLLLILVFAWTSKDLGKNSAQHLAIKNSKERERLLDETSHYMQQPHVTYGFAKMPIKVFINSSYYKFITEKTFYAWQRASNNLVTFEFVTNEEIADIKILFKNESAPENAYGYSSISVNQATKFIESSEIDIFLLDPMEKRQLPDKMIYSVLIHEIGHSLGVIDHSNINTDIMSESAQNIDRELAISQRDMNTLKIIYAR